MQIGLKKCIFKIQWTKKIRRSKCVNFCRLCYQWNVERVGDIFWCLSCQLSISRDTLYMNHSLTTSSLKLNLIWIRSMSKINIYWYLSVRHTQTIDICKTLQKKKKKRYENSNNNTGIKTFGFNVRRCYVVYILDIMPWNKLKTYKLKYIKSEWNKWNMSAIR